MSSKTRSAPISSSAVIIPAATTPRIPPPSRTSASRAPSPCSPAPRPERSRSWISSRTGCGPARPRSVAVVGALPFVEAALVLVVGLGLAGVEPAAVRRLLVVGVSDPLVEVADLRIVRLLADALVEAALDRLLGSRRMLHRRLF